MTVEHKSLKIYSQPTSDSLQKLQKILTKRLHREITLQETKIAYHNLMEFAFALVDLVPEEIKK